MYYELALQLQLHIGLKIPPKKVQYRGSLAPLFVSKAKSKIYGFFKIQTAKHQLR